jgi:O-antigen/teichoic acid export membrane protein
MGLRLVGIAVGSSFGLTQTVVGIVCAQAVATTVALAAGRAAMRRFPAHAPVTLGDDRREILRFVVQSSVATGVISLRTSLVPVLLGIVAGPTSVGLFRVAQAPQSGLAAASSPIRLILLTEQTRDWERGERATVVRGVTRFSLAALGAMVVTVPPFLLLMPWLVETVFGAEYTGAVTAARIVLLSAAFQLVLGWTKSFPTSIGRPGLRILTHGIEGAVTLPLVLVLGSIWGVSGAAAAMLVATGVFGLVWLVLLARIRHDLVTPGGGPTGALAR